MSRVKTLNPTKNKASEIWSKRGSMDAIPKTFHASSPARRKWRMRSCPCGDADAKAMYARSHCFTRMAKDAVARLITKLVNHRMFIRMAATEGWKGAMLVEATMVEFTTCPPRIVYVAVWFAIARSTWSVSLAMSSCSWG